MTAHARTKIKREAANATAQMIPGEIDEPTVQITTGNPIRDPVCPESDAIRDHGAIATGDEGYLNASQ